MPNYISTLGSVDQKEDSVEKTFESISKVIALNIKPFTYDQCLDSNDSCKNDLFLRNTYDVAGETARDFFCSGAFLPEGDHIAWMLCFDEKARFDSFAFAYKGSRVKEKDLKWIFRKCAVPSRIPDGVEKMFYGNGRRVYTLDDSIGRGFERTDDWVLDGCSELFKVLCDANVYIQLIGGSDFNNNDHYGRILISTPGVMPVRLAALLTKLFGGKTILEVGKNEKRDDVLPCCSRRALEDFMGYAIKYAMNNISYYYKTNKGCRWVEGYSDATALEDLELSVRAYNCLIRSGHKTLGDIKDLDEIDFCRIRNMGRKGTEEVLEKLKELSCPPDEIFGEKETPDSFELDDLIGLENIKEQVRKMCAFADLKRDMIKSGSRNAYGMSLHMEFVGNPGTAKTTVARILADRFCRAGLIKNRNLTEVGRADLVASYTGQTADKVKSVFEKGKGGIIFIDEAYSLLDYYERGFGDEAINTIVQEMENNRDDTIVIFAGYPDKMKEFFSRNPGLRSRVPNRICFEDYSAEEMVLITEYQAKSKGFSIDEDGMIKVNELCRYAAGKPDLGNGRFCRNIVENAVMGYAQRVYGSLENQGSGSVFNLRTENDFVLRQEDFSMPETGEVKRRVIGY